MSVSSYSVFTYFICIRGGRNGWMSLNDASSFFDLSLRSNPSLNILYCMQGGACVGTSSNSKKKWKWGQSQAALLPGYVVRQQCSNLCRSSTHWQWIRYLSPLGLVCWRWGLQVVVRCFVSLKSSGYSRRVVVLLLGIVSGWLGGHCWWVVVIFGGGHRQWAVGCWLSSMGPPPCLAPPPLPCLSLNLPSRIHPRCRQFESLRHHRFMLFSWNWVVVVELHRHGCGFSTAARGL